MTTDIMKQLLPGYGRLTVEDARTILNGLRILRTRPVEERQCFLAELREKIGGDPNGDTVCNALERAVMEPEA